MKAMLLREIVDLNSNPEPLQLAEVPLPEPGPTDILLRVITCGICHTELDEIEGRTPPAFFPMVLGHQVVGEVIRTGRAVESPRIGDRVGVAWIYSACGECPHCRKGNENLCPRFQATGRDQWGGYAEYMRVPAAAVFPVPERFSACEAAPLLCAGAIGYRSLRLTGIINGQRLGLTGFGASAHLVLKMVRHKFPATPVSVFARSPEERAFALQLGAAWAGDTSDTAPEPCDAIIDTTPVWTPVIEALRNLAPAGRLVVNAIRKENIDREVWSRLDYARHLWLEKEIKSVANVTRCDVCEFLDLAAVIPIVPEFEPYRLEDVNRALLELKNRRIRGAKVLVIGE